jgi:hypothetical protein
MIELLLHEQCAAVRTVRGDTLGDHTGRRGAWEDDETLREGS